MKAILFVCFLLLGVVEAKRPHVVLVMADDMGWGQTGYQGHPMLKTPHLDAMAENGLRFDRFYAGASNCSPTRATVLTGRTNDRTGVENHGHALRLQEKTIAQAMKAAGYATGHFGKWHLNGVRGTGAPVVKDDPYSPGAFGFETWLSVTNFFDMDPMMSRNGEFEMLEGDSSEIIVAEALKWIKEETGKGRETFSVIWYGTPHSPFEAFEKDMEGFEEGTSRDHYGELVAMDRSIGALRAGLREMGIGDDTLVWFCSDNGGLKVTPESVGGLRGLKNSMYEGGLRVPGVIEWPGGIKEGRVTSYPAGTVDIFPTVAEVCGLPKKSMLKPVDGESLVALFDAGSAPETRENPLMFRHSGRGAVVDNAWKLVVDKKRQELFHLGDDKAEETNLAKEKPEVFGRLMKAYEAFDASIERSVAGKDYAEGKVEPEAPNGVFWPVDERYVPYLGEFKKSERLRGFIEKKGG